MQFGPQSDNRVTLPPLNPVAVPEKIISGSYDIYVQTELFQDDLMETEGFAPKTHLKSSECENTY